MATYRITSEAGVDMGTYDAEGPEQALDCLARDAGYKNMDDAEKQGFRRCLTATEITD